MRGFAAELRLAARTLLRARGFTTATVAILALGIGATTAIFSVVNGVLLRPLPFPQPERIVQVLHVGEDGRAGLNFSYPNFVDVREGVASFRAIGAYQAGSATVSGVGGDGAFRADAARVTDGFFESMGVRPFLGRTLAAGETGGAGAASVVVSHGFWRDRLGGARPGQATVRVDDRSLDVVGVMPPGFAFPAGAELWLPSDASLANQTRTGHNFRVVARLASAVDLQGAQAELSAVARALAERYGDDTWMKDARAVDLREQLVGRSRSALLVLLGGAGVLLAIACANVVNLLLARTLSRQREMAVRVALGAGRARLTRSLLAEALVLSTAGGALGVLGAWWGVPALLALEPGGVPRLGEVHVDVGVLFFALAVTVGAALALAVAGAVQAGRFGSAGLSGGAAGGRGGGPGRGAHRLRQALAASQIALTLVLLVGAGLLGRSFLNLFSLDPGYRTRGALVMDLWLPGGREDAAAAAGGFHEELLERLRGLPGVETVGGVNVFPLGGGGSNGNFVELERVGDVAAFAGLTFREIMARPELMARLESMLNDPERSGDADFRVATAGWFEAMGIPLLEGRLFDTRDAPDAPHVAVVSRTLAEARWPEGALGKVVEFGNMDGDLRPFTIVGVVGDVRESSLEAQPRPVVYASTRQRPSSSFRYHVAIRGGRGADLAPAARAVVAALNPDVAVGFRTLEQVFAASLSGRRFSLLLLGVFGGVALLLAVVGTYGVVAYLVSQRTREIGIRMALGATAGSVRAAVVGQGLGLAAVGVAGGVLAGWALSRYLSAALYGVPPSDPLTYAGAAVVLTLAVAAASGAPAARAASIDPARSLRSE